MNLGLRLRQYGRSHRSPGCTSTAMRGCRPFEDVMLRRGYGCALLGSRSEAPLAALAPVLAALCLAISCADSAASAQPLWPTLTAAAQS